MAGEHTDRQGESPGESPGEGAQQVTLRRRRRAGARKKAASSAHWLSQLPYVLALCGVAGSLVMYATNHFRKGSALLAAGVLFGALARLVLPESQVGMLAIRKKWLDVLTMTALAVAVAVVAWVVPGD
ncbi:MULTISPECIES: DUF3017 domain-containing protein [Thermomonospora]|uniref:DUF3017 domain-containing protein n=1 Tax=Thermomonospora curvata (strain ATCC 19995 / DSM 43183 / JCM 3096 / KCTC 9072 / NBRC 15933 / NCIMB 10081 / Henssen B9) TaxID=471852 RepID=D1A285_THECD|nr:MULTISPECIES: DUF3017 domain-containing protein [Thermomonospora]ACY99738.1 hypothetical protein Tcur_4211 [Thermomonospora curvata DSM 43183]PKK12749.1 MAG: DUF3017 domain-containing protein [Thermomonospora sp. CIF 1]